MDDPITHRVLRFRFLQSHCPYPNHWCNGKHIPDIDLNNFGYDRNNGVMDQPPCEHFDMKKRRCRHPEHRFRSKGDGI